VEAEFVEFTLLSGTRGGGGNLGNDRPKNASFFFFTAYDSLDTGLQITGPERRKRW